MKILENLSKSIGAMRSANSAIISVENSAVRFYIPDKSKKDFSVQVETFKVHNFDDEFFETLQNVIKIHFIKKGAKAVLVLPDALFFTDTLKLPLVNKRVMNESIALAFNSLYKNYNDLKYNSFPVYRDKKNVVYSVVGIRKDILNKFISSASLAGVNVVGVTSATSAMTNGAMMLNSKVKNDDCAVVDVKESCSNLALVAKGKTVGYFTIPFGYETFLSDRIVREEEVLDHSSARLLVINAQELAKRKRLTTAMKVEDETDTEDIADAKSAKKLRNLPKYLLRDMPDEENKVIYENFRPIVKWTLEVIRESFRADGFIDIENVYFNLPSKFSFLPELANEEGGSKVKFLPLANATDKENIITNLELYGATAIGKYNRQNNF